MQCNEKFASLSEQFDDDRIIPASGLVEVMELARRAGLAEAVDEHVRMTGQGAANAAAKVLTLVAAMCVGVDSIEAVDVVRSGATRRLFSRVYAPSTIGTFLRAMTAESAAGLAAAAVQSLVGLAQVGQVMVPARDRSGRSDPAIPDTTSSTSRSGAALTMLDIDDTVLPVGSGNKENVGFTYARCMGLAAHLLTVSRTGSRPLIVASELRPGAASGKPGGAAELLTPALTAVTTAFEADPSKILLRGDSAYYACELLNTARNAGINVSVGVKMWPNIARIIAGIAADDWTGIDYPNATYNTDTDTWDSDAQVAEVAYTAFTSRSHKKSQRIPGRLVVRRVLLANPTAKQKTAANKVRGTTTAPDKAVQLAIPAEQMPVYRYHAIFTTLPARHYSAVDVDQIHRDHAIIEQVNADLKSSALTHLPTTSFAGNAAWLHLTTMAYNLMRAAAALTATPDRPKNSRDELANATSDSLRHKLINVPGHITRSARRTTLHLPRNWPWADHRHRLRNALSPPIAA